MADPARRAARTMTVVTLEDLIAQRISTSGPLTIAEYMAECLLHPTLGYYTTRAPFGAEGDFTTAPEISQMFGELIGLCLAQSWMDQGGPAPFTLLELGPGRGVLMADILRATEGVPGFHAVMQIVLLEASEQLRDAQRQALSEYEVAFAAQVDDLPRQPIFAVANEFFDALPIRQFQRTDKSWRERQVGLSDGQLCIGLGPESPQPALNDRLADTDPGNVVEYAPGAAAVMAGLGARIADFGGTALIIDYGDWRSLGDTLQAITSHRHADPLAEPGRADLTAHVDFEALAAAVPCKHTRLTPQGVFLERLGITRRAQSLASGLSGADLQQHIAAHRRLTHPDEMGKLFKVLGLFPEGRNPPPGLDI
jgi:SAM-dependent MidA family methyltransferase